MLDECMGMSLNSCIKHPGNAGSFEDKEGGDNWLMTNHPQHRQ